VQDLRRVAEFFSLLSIFVRHPAGAVDLSSLGFRGLPLW
jgi:hypothetical protein